MLSIHLKNYKPYGKSFSIFKQTFSSDGVRLSSPNRHGPPLRRHGAIVPPSTVLNLKIEEGSGWTKLDSFGQNKYNPSVYKISCTRARCGGFLPLSLKRYDYGQGTAISSSPPITAPVIFLEYQIKVNKQLRKIRFFIFFAKL